MSGRREGEKGEEGEREGGKGGREGGQFLVGTREALRRFCVCVKKSIMKRKRPRTFGESMFPLFIGLCHP